MSLNKSSATSIVPGLRAQPTIADFVNRLPANDARRNQLLRNLIASDLEFRWSKKIGRPLEDYLREWPELGGPNEAPIDLIQIEWSVRGEFDPHFDGGDYKERFPRQWSDLETRVTPPDGQLSLRSTPADRSAGTVVAPPVVPGYTIEGEIARGGMGVVYRARQNNLRRLVAIKMVGVRAGAASEINSRFRIEAEAVASLQHPNIVQIHDLLEHDGRSFIVMEYVGGGSLAEKLKSGPMAPAEAAELVATIAQAMHVAHCKQIIHRDLKPANILLSSDGAPKISDFGLAKRLDEEHGLTPSDAVLGTPCYMAPEQSAGKTGAVGPAADIYALGAILYEMLTGRPPFRGSSAVDVLMQVLSDEPTPPRQLRPEIPSDLEAICLQCLRKDPSKRPASALVLADSLRQLRLENRGTANQQVAPDAISRAVRDSVAPVAKTKRQEVPPVKSRRALDRESEKGPSKPILRRKTPFPRWPVSLAILLGIGVSLAVYQFVFRRGQPKAAEGELKNEAPKTIVGLPADERPGNGDMAERPKKVDEIKPQITKIDPAKLDRPVVEKKEGPPSPIVKRSEITFDLNDVGVKMDLIKIPARGKKFLMGSPKEEVGRKDDEVQHEVTFGHDFYMGKYEVTQEQYEAITGENPSSSVRYPKCPVDCITWNSAQEFAKKLNQKFKDRKVKFRLPSEAEWEYACRAGTTMAFHFGATLGREQANLENRPSKPVGCFDANAFGLYDMHGNVAEWCEDYYGPYSAAPKDGTPQMVNQYFGCRVYRSGQWDIDPLSCRSAFRQYSPGQDQCSGVSGFRIVVSVDEAVDIKKESLKPPIVERDEISFDLRSGVKLELILISAKGKKFLMGSPKGEEGRDYFEVQHEVTFGHDFYLGKYEVTQEQYQSITGTNWAKTKGPRIPVMAVSWDLAQEFTRKLNEKFKDRKVKFRLPSEAEWEYACRAGTTTAYNTGDALGVSAANVGVPYSSGLKPVGTYKPNAFGLYDMHGNIAEWCEDCVGPYSKAPLDGTAQLIQRSDNLRVLRGGSWFIDIRHCRSASRIKTSPDKCIDYMGFRVAASREEAKITTDK